MAAVLSGLAMVAASLAGLWLLQARGRRRRCPSGARLPQAAARALGVYVAEGLGWLLCLIVLVLGLAVMLWGHASTV